MHWIHRNGIRDHFYATWDLLDQKSLLNIGWQCLIKNPEIVSAIESNDQEKLRQLNIRDVLRNFAQMTSGDIVIVLPIREFDPRLFVVKIKSSRAISALHLSSKFQSGFVTQGLDDKFEKVNFNLDSGFYYGNDPNDFVDAGFFHEVEILARFLRDSMSQEMQDLFRFQQTNLKIYDPQKQQIIFDSLPKDVQSKIPRP